MSSKLDLSAKINCHGTDNHENKKLSTFTDMNLFISKMCKTLSKILFSIVLKKPVEIKIFATNTIIRMKTTRRVFFIRRINDFFCFSKNTLNNKTNEIKEIKYCNSLILQVY